MAMDKPETFKDTNPAATIIADNILAADTASFARIIQRRNELGDKIRFGVIALNSGSLLSLAALMGARGEASNWLQLDAPHARLAAVAFVAGVVGASIAPFFDHLKLTHEAADAYARMSAARSVAITQAEIVTDRNKVLRQTAMERYLALPLVDFQTSTKAIACQNVGVGGWLVGAVIVAGHLVGFFR
ncbi:hypothetical protein ASE65_15565 [Sphingomonas sp. Leaf16]|nr:hypothetical protein ASE65_15565 [Sphingomonas sp. Leaf16]KQN16818.1 hypothetical protein ASE81_15615 [Sphingomonas sp. Leaf29]